MRTSRLRAVAASAASSRGQTRLGSIYVHHQELIIHLLPFTLHNSFAHANIPSYRNYRGLNHGQPRTPQDSQSRGLTIGINGERRPGTLPDLSNASFYRADLMGAELMEADLRGSNFELANLGMANLRGADFSGAILPEAVLRNADLDNSDFTDALVGFTVFGDNDLSTVKGLETVRHLGPLDHRH